MQTRDSKQHGVRCQSGEVGSLHHHYQIGDDELIDRKFFLTISSIDTLLMNLINLLTQTNANAPVTEVATVGRKSANQLFQVIINIR